MALPRDTNGKVPAYAWPGGYPIIYVCADGGILCPACANGEHGSYATEDLDAPLDWRLEGFDVFYEGAPTYCDHCNCCIESAYDGDPEMENP